VIVVALVTAVQPLTLRFHADPLHLRAGLGLVVAGALLVCGAVALRLERRGATMAGLGALAVGVVVTLLALDIGARAPFYNHLYPMRATAAHPEHRIAPGAAVGYTEANRGTALAVNLRRPLRQLEPSALAAPPPPSSPPYLLLPEVQFHAARAAWSLEYVDDVRVHDVRYVLARVGAP
jgi:hypothetical protein